MRFRKCEKCGELYEPGNYYKEGRQKDTAVILGNSVTVYCQCKCNWVSCLVYYFGQEIPGYAADEDSQGRSIQTVGGNG